MVKISYLVTWAVVIAAVCSLALLDLRSKGETRSAYRKAAISVLGALVILGTHYLARLVSLIF